MPLPNPWKSPHDTRSASPHRRKTSLRHRAKARIGLLILIAILTLCTLNELRCMQYGCASRISFTGGARGGGATLPDDWKYRLGEQLKTNMEDMGPSPPAPPASKQEQKPQTEQHDAPPNGALVEPLTITPTIDALKPAKQHSNPALQEAGDGRWIDAPPGPMSPDKETKAQMKADKQTYVDGDEIESPPPKLNAPPTEASPNPLATPSPGVQVAAEDLRVENTTAAAGAVPDSAAKASPPPPKVDKMKEKVDSAIALKTVAKASQPAVPSVAGGKPQVSPAQHVAVPPAPETAKKPSEGIQRGSSPALPPPSSLSRPLPPPGPIPPPHTHDTLTPPHDANSFGSMEMGLLMAGG